MFSPLFLLSNSQQTVSLFFFKTWSHLRDSVPTRIYPPFWHLQTLHLHRLPNQPVFFSFTWKEHHSMILVSALGTILLLFLYCHISLKRSSRIFLLPVLKPGNTFYPFISFCSISVPTLGFPFSFLWALYTEHLWKFSLGPGLFLLLWMFCLLPG